jgi:hypothetical protein
MITTQELLETSIGQLRILAAFLSEQLGGRADRSKSESAETRACRDILDQLTALILKLESVGSERLILSPDRPLQSIGHSITGSIRHLLGTAAAALPR